MQQAAAIDFTKLAHQFSDTDTWIVLVLVAAAGLLGGVARKFTAQSNDRATLGADVIVGAITALAMLIVVPADSAIKLLSFSIVAGYAGKSVLEALRARAEKLVAEQKQQAAVAVGKAAIQEARKTVAASQTPVLHLADDQRVMVMSALKGGTVGAALVADTSGLDALERRLDALM